MKAITVSRQMGSQGSELAVQVAQQLGWQRISRALINQAAKAAGVPQVALAEIDELGLFGLHPTRQEQQAYLVQVETYTRTLADQGNIVIVGRAGQVILQNEPEVLHIRVVAPLEKRVQWLQQRQKVSAQAAQTRLRESDRTRSHHLQEYYHHQIDDPILYHLIINTGCVDLSLAVNLVVQCCQAGEIDSTARH